MKDLTIAIPTFNRPHHLYKLLSTIVSYECSKHVKILISENYPQHPETKNVINYFSLLLDISHIQQTSQIGALGNEKYCFCNSTTDYVLVIGDDDLIKLDNIFESLLIIKSSPKASAIYNNIEIVSISNSGSKNIKHTNFDLSFDSIDHFFLSLLRINLPYYNPFEKKVKNGKFNYLWYSIFRTEHIRVFFNSIYCFIGNERDLVSYIALCGDILINKNIGVIKNYHTLNSGQKPLKNLKIADPLLYNYKMQSSSIISKIKISLWIMKNNDASLIKKLIHAITTIIRAALAKLGSINYYINIIIHYLSNIRSFFSYQ